MQEDERCAALERFGKNIDEAQGARRALDNRSEGADGIAHGRAADVSRALQQDTQPTRAVLLTWMAVCMSAFSERARLAVHPEVAWVQACQRLEVRPEAGSLRMCCLCSHTWGRKANKGYKCKSN